MARSKKASDSRVQSQKTGLDQDRRVKEGTDLSGSASFNVLEGGGVCSPAGFKAAAVAAGVKEGGALDLAMIAADTECPTAAVFTRNQVVAAPVILDRESLAQNRGWSRGVVVNAGNANACTGQQGVLDARAMQSAAAEGLACRPESILVMSTGIIGVPLPIHRIVDGIAGLSQGLSSSDAAGQQMAEAMRTTDRFPKQFAMEVDSPAGKYRIGGVAKGAGMIHPNMATMLSIITCDAEIRPAALEEALQTAVNESFNRISVDGDTSTNDTVCAMASGASGTRILAADRLVWQDFVSNLTTLCRALARMIVSDGEGASRIAKVRVVGAASDEDAAAVQHAITTSPLVKTALAGGDPNWGRIVAAAGRANAQIEPDRLNITIAPDSADYRISGDRSRVDSASDGHSGADSSPASDRLPPLMLCQNGERPPNWSKERLKLAEAIFALDSMSIEIDLGIGRSSDWGWTCDLGHNYVELNSEYST